MIRMCHSEDIEDDKVWEKIDVLAMLERGTELNQCSVGTHSRLLLLVPGDYQMNRDELG